MIRLRFLATLASMEIYIYHQKGGVESGPYSLAEVQAMVRDGDASESDRARREGVGGWVSLGELLKDVSPALLPSDNEALSEQITDEPSRRYKPTFFQILMWDSILQSCLGCAVPAFGFPAVYFTANFLHPDVGTTSGYQYVILYFLFFGSFAGPVLAVRRV